MPRIMMQYLGGKENAEGSKTETTTTPIVATPTQMPSVQPSPATRTEAPTKVDDTGQ